MGIVIAQLLVGITQLLRLVSDDVVILTGHSLDLFLSFNSCIGRSNWDLRNIKPMVRRGCVLMKEKGRGGRSLHYTWVWPCLSLANPPSIQHVCMYCMYAMLQ